MSKSFKDFIYLISSNAILKVLGIVSIMIYTRYLVKDELALVPFFNSMGRLSMVVFSFGILPTLVREIPSLLLKKDTETVQSYILTALMIIVPGVFLFSLLSYFFADFVSLHFFQTERYTSQLKLMAVGFFFSGINQSFSYIYWCLSRFQQESNRLVVVGIVQVVMGISFVLLWGVHGLIAALILSNVVSCAIYLYNLKDILFISSAFKLYPIKRLISTSLPFYFESYLIYFRSEGDQLLVAGLLGSEALAVYYIAKRPYEILTSFTDSLDKVLTTSLAKFKHDMQVFNQKVSSIITLNTHILFPVILLTIGVTPTFIVLIAGEQYQGAVIPAMVLLLWLIAQVSWKTALGKSVFILHSSSSRFKITLVETITLLGLILLLGNFFGILGVVTGRFIATVLAGFFAYYLIKKDLQLTIDMKSIASITAHSLVMCVLLLLSQYFFSSYTILAFSLLFSVCLFLYLIHRTVSEKFYAVINSISPFRINDPYSYIFSVKKESKAS